MWKSGFESLIGESFIEKIVPLPPASVLSRNIKSWMALDELLRKHGRPVTEFSIFHFPFVRSLWTHNRNIIHTSNAKRFTIFRAIPRVVFISLSTALFIIIGSSRFICYSVIYGDGSVSLIQYFFSSLPPPTLWKSVSARCRIFDNARGAIVHSRRCLVFIAERVGWAFGGF